MEAGPIEAGPMEAFRIENISKAFSNVPAIRGITLRVSSGATVAFIGPSGCGKTTLLRCIALFERVDAGAIFWRGKPVITAEPGHPAEIHLDADTYRSRVGTVFQTLNLWPHLSVLDNLTLAARVVLREGRRPAEGRALHLLETTGIADKAREYPADLSGGQKQRVALARALMLDPEVLLLDEITSALDPELVGEVLGIIADLSSRGITMLLVTHQISFASELADYVVFLDGGVIVEQGDPREVLVSPQTGRLRSFLTRIKRVEYGGNS